MKRIQLTPLLLSARLVFTRVGAGTCATAALWLTAASTLAWAAQQRERLSAERAGLALERHSLAVPTKPEGWSQPLDNDNLAAFYAVLGEEREAEQHLKVLFGMAAEAGLTLRQGEYKVGHDRASQASSYQILLPVRGSYIAIWQFAIEALRSLPFASLDDISFKRDSVSDALVEARLRITLHLREPQADTTQVPT